MKKIYNLLIIPLLCFGQVVTEDCISIPDPGECDAAFEIYYFDQNTLSCEYTWWGGCNGLVPFWTLEDCQNNCENNSFIIEKNTNKSILKIIDILGRETTSKGLQLYIYDDGSVEKKYGYE